MHGKVGRASLADEQHHRCSRRKEGGKHFFLNFARGGSSLAPTCSTHDAGVTDVKG